MPKAARKTQIGRQRRRQSAAPYPADIVDAKEEVGEGEDIREQQADSFQSMGDEVVSGSGSMSEEGESGFGSMGGEQGAAAAPPAVEGGEMEGQQGQAEEGEGSFGSMSEEGEEEALIRTLKDNSVEIMRAVAQGLAENAKRKADTAEGDLGGLMRIRADSVALDQVCEASKLFEPNMEGVATGIWQKLYDEQAAEKSIEYLNYERMLKSWQGVDDSRVGGGLLKLINDIKERSEENSIITNTCKKVKAVKAVVSSRRSARTAKKEVSKFKDKIQEMCNLNEKILKDLIKYEGNPMQRTDVPDKFTKEHISRFKKIILDNQDRGKSDDHGILFEVMQEAELLNKELIKYKKELQKAEKARQKIPEDEKSFSYVSLNNVLEREPNRAQELLLLWFHILGNKNAAHTDSGFKSEEVMGLISNLYKSNIDKVAFWGYNLSPPRPILEQSTRQQQEICGWQDILSVALKNSEEEKEVRDKAMVAKQPVIDVYYSIVMEAMAKKTSQGGGGIQKGGMQRHPHAHYKWLLGLPIYCWMTGPTKYAMQKTGAAQMASRPPPPALTATANNTSTGSSSWKSEKEAAAARKVNKAKKGAQTKQARKAAAAKEPELQAEFSSGADEIEHVRNIITQLLNHWQSLGMNAPPHIKDANMIADMLKYIFHGEASDEEYERVAIIISMLQRALQSIEVLPSTSCFNQVKCSADLINTIYSILSPEVWGALAEDLSWIESDIKPCEDSIKALVAEMMKDGKEKGAERAHLKGQKCAPNVGLRDRRNFFSSAGGVLERIYNVFFTKRRETAEELAAVATQSSKSFMEQINEDGSEFLENVLRERISYVIDLHNTLVGRAECPVSEAGARVLQAAGLGVRDLNDMDEAAARRLGLSAEDAQLVGAFDEDTANKRVKMNSVVIAFSIQMVAVTSMMRLSELIQNIRHLPSPSEGGAERTLEDAQTLFDKLPLEPEMKENIKADIQKMAKAWVFGEKGAADETEEERAEREAREKQYQADILYLQELLSRTGGELFKIAESARNFIRTLTFKGLEKICTDYMASGVLQHFLNTYAHANVNTKTYIEMSWNKDIFRNRPEPQEPPGEHHLQIWKSPPSLMEIFGGKVTPEIAKKRLFAKLGRQVRSMRGGGLKGGGDAIALPTRLRDSSEAAAARQKDMDLDLVVAEPSDKGGTGEVSGSPSTPRAQTGEQGLRLIGHTTAERSREPEPEPDTGAAPPAAPPPVTEAAPPSAPPPVAGAVPRAAAPPPVTEAAPPAAPPEVAGAAPAAPPPFGDTPADILSEMVHKLEHSKTYWDIEGDEELDTHMQELITAAIFGPLPSGEMETFVIIDEVDEDEKEAEIIYGEMQDMYEQLVGDIPQSRSKSKQRKKGKKKRTKAKKEKKKREKRSRQRSRQRSRTRNKLRKRKPRSKSKRKHPKKKSMKERLRKTLNKWLQ